MITYRRLDVAQNEAADILELTFLKAVASVIKWDCNITDPSPRGPDESDKLII